MDGHWDRSGWLRDCDGALIEKALGAAITVHECLGPVLPESVCERALMVELEYRGIPAQRQAGVPVSNRNSALGVGLRADIVVDQRFFRTQSGVCSDRTPCVPDNNLFEIVEAEAGPDTEFQQTTVERRHTPSLGLSALCPSR